MLSKERNETHHADLWSNFFVYLKYLLKLWFYRWVLPSMGWNFFFINYCLEPYGFMQRVHGWEKGNWAQGKLIARNRRAMCLCHISPHNNWGRRILFGRNKGHNSPVELQWTGPKERHHCAASPGFRSRWLEAKNCIWVGATCIGVHWQGQAGGKLLWWVPGEPQPPAILPLIQALNT